MKIQDGLLLVVPANIFGYNLCTLIDIGTIRCFTTRACGTMCGLKANPCDVFLELGNGEKFLSRGFVPDFPTVTAGLTVKVGSPVTNLLYDADLMLGMT